MNRISTRTRIGMALIALPLLISGGPLHAGPLTPSAGPVSPTGKTTQEVFDKVAVAEPRIPINSTNTPGFDTIAFIISQPGSYYLPGNITATPGKTVLIEILASGVTLDLGGFQLSGVGIAQHAVRVSPGLPNVLVKNGFISGCLSHGITSNGLLCEVTNLNVSNCAGNGIDLNALSRVTNCAVRSNGSHGIRVGSNSIVSNCLSSTNTVNGIEALGGSVITDCICEGNAVGMLLGSNCLVSNSRVSNPAAASSVAFLSGNGDSGTALTDCRATGGGRGFSFQGGRVSLTRCSATGMTGGQNAFDVGLDSTLSDCRADNNSGTGFVLANRYQVQSCAATQNVGDGFRSTGTSSGSFIQCNAVGNSANGFNVGDGATVQACIANNNLQRGVSLTNGGSVINCTTRNNQNDGIAVNFSCLVQGNSCNGDGAGIGVDAAIRATGQANRIDGNNISFADRGLLVSSGGNTIFRNSVKGCTVNFDIIGGNDVGPIGSAATTTSPWANIQF